LEVLGCLLEMDQIWRRPDHELEVIRPRGDASLGVRESDNATY
jgi:hypothetical protein